MSGFYLGLNTGQAEANKYCNNVSNCDNADTSVRSEVGFSSMGIWVLNLVIQTSKHFLVVTITT